MWYPTPLELYTTFSFMSAQRFVHHVKKLKLLILSHKLYCIHEILFIQRKCQNETISSASKARLMDASRTQYFIFSYFSVYGRNVGTLMKTELLLS